VSIVLQYPCKQEYIFAYMFCIFLAGPLINLLAIFLNIFFYARLLNTLFQLILIKSLLPGNNQYRCQMRKHSRDSSWARTHNAWIERHTSLPVGHHYTLSLYHSSYICILCDSSGSSHLASAL
jgi:hypothetical protein